MPDVTITSTHSAERAQFLADIIITALEGGIGYWATALRYRWCDSDENQLDPALIHAIVMEDDDIARIVVDEAIEQFMDSNDGERPDADDLLGMGISNDVCEPVLHKIDIETIAKGIGIIAGDEDFCATRIRKPILHANIDNEAGDIDADGADAIVQAALFGKLVFG